MAHPKANVIKSSVYVTYHLRSFSYVHFPCYLITLPVAMVAMVTPYTPSPNHPYQVSVIAHRLTQMHPVIYLSAPLTQQQT